MGLLLSGLHLFNYHKIPTLYKNLGVCSSFLPLFNNPHITIYQATVCIRMSGEKLQLKIPSARRDIEQLKLSCIVGGNGKWDNHSGKHFLKKLNI